MQIYFHHSIYDYRGTIMSNRTEKWHLELVRRIEKIKRGFIMIFVLI